MRMYPRFKYLMITLLVGSLALAACSKKVEETDAPKLEVETAASAEIQGAKIQDVMSNLPAFSAEELEKAKAELSTLMTSTFSEWETQEFATESEKANALFDLLFDMDVDRSPIYQSYLGIKKDYDKWDDNSDEQAQENLELKKLQLEKIKSSLNFDTLDDQTKISYRLAVDAAEREIKNFKYRFHNYPVNQMFGVQSGAPAFMINIHQVTDLSDAQAYVSRLRGLTERFDNVIDGLNRRADMGIIAPKFVYPYVISDSENILVGRPFDKSTEDSTILADFKKKISAIDLDETKQEELMNEASSALVNNVKPAYEKLIAAIKVIEAQADERDGVWKFPDGANFYNVALENTTTTTLTSDEIHEIGLSEVARIHDEMRAIMKQVNFEGDLQAFFEFMRTDPQFYKPETDEGREEYLAENRAVIEDMKTRLDELFLTVPKADLIVKRVEPFREKSAGKAFYNSPAPDGSRPGIYYANLYEMSQMPTYQMRALAYHEGIPGHHMQLAISQELEGLPKFRKFGGYTAHTEGWGLYSEYLPKEIGLYEDPYSDFGRLSMELWRACRLVVDTGIHAKKWTRQEGIDYYSTNTPNPTDDGVKMVERHIVMASQATAYKVGMLKILELREKAKKDLGEKFDIREFHDVVITNGALPLNVLEQLVNEWVASKA